jgi:hypothetical protein
MFQRLRDIANDNRVSLDSRPRAGLVGCDNGKSESNAGVGNGSEPVFFVELIRQKSDWVVHPFGREELLDIGYARCNCSLE